MPENPKVLSPKAGQTYFSPVYLRKQTGPISPARGRRWGVTGAKVNLQFAREVMTQIQIGHGGLAYLANASGGLIAHPDIGLVSQRSDLSKLPQIAAATAGRSASGVASNVAKDSRGHDVLPPLRRYRCWAGMGLWNSP